MRNDATETIEAPSGGARPLVGVFVALSLAAIFFTWALTWQTGPERLNATGPLPVIAAVPDFSLTERSGRQVTRADFQGKVWVADFIFTRCSGPCPELSAKMRTIQRELEGERSVRLVSICLDPENDTPSALVDYAKRFNADPERWLFLTSTNEKDVHALVEKGFLQSVVPESEGSALMHSTYFVVIDGHGRIRAAHNGMEANARELVLRDVRALLAELAAA
jgi:cytochrome oxidase Cu insertion factor (SCO1/SenC/PrrC family)